MEVNALQDRLRDVGLRATGSRVAVLRTLVTGHDHPRVDEVRERVLAGGLSISVQATYDACEVLHDAGLARRLHVAGAPVRYEARVGDNHHHLICRICAATVDINCIEGSAPCLTPDESHGFALDEAEVTFWGTCSDCQSRKGELHV
ncbi:MAG: Fur family transcriptional regulator [Solirubrobacterales bacterium]